MNLKRWYVATLAADITIVLLSSIGCSYPSTGNSSISLESWSDTQQPEDVGDPAPLQSGDLSESLLEVDDSGNQTEDTPSDVSDSEIADDQLLNASVWESRMMLPSNEAVSSYHSNERSPYITCRPEFPGTSGFIEFSVDFKADAQPIGTYLAVCNWDMDTRELSSRFEYVGRDYPGVAAHAGFQVLADGSRVANMNVWDTYLIDANGTHSTLRATKTYPDNPRSCRAFDNEGYGVRTMVDYNWRPGETYRALIQCNQTEVGTTELLFYVCDLATGRWDKLISYDLGFGNSYMTSPCSFLENFDTDTSAAVRTMEVGNFRVNSLDKKEWVTASTATMSESWVYKYPGSYAYGSDGSYFWAITSAMPGLSKTQTADEQLFEVSQAQTGCPY